PGDMVRYVYFGLLSAYFVWGLFILVWTGDQPIQLLKVSGVILNFILGFSALHTLAVNMILLPKPLRPGWIGRIGVFACWIFFSTISVLGGPGVLRDLGILSEKCFLRLVGIVQGAEVPNFFQGEVFFSPPANGDLDARVPVRRPSQE